MTREQALQRVAEIDARFQDAKWWGAWMIGAANEREALAEQFGLPHKYRARNADGSRTD